MKSKFSTSWVRSKQPRKQRKYRAEAPLHIKHKFLSANLSKELRKKHGKRSVPIRKGDEILVMRGSFRKKKAKVSLIDLKRTRLALEGVQRSKKDGTKVNVYFNPSSLQIQALNLDDKKRISALNRKSTKEAVKNAP
jgi:large subunit ribosomal protein L24